MSKTLPVSVRMDPALKEALKQLAEADRRSLANYIELVLEDHVKRTGKRGARKAK